MLRDGLLILALHFSRSMSALLGFIKILVTRWFLEDETMSRNLESILDADSPRASPPAAAKKSLLSRQVNEDVV